MWDEEDTPPAISNQSSTSVNGFCIGRGRGFGSMTTMVESLPKLGSQNLSSNTNTYDDDGWDESPTTNQNDYTSSYKSNNNMGSWNNNNSNDRVFKSRTDKGKGCFKCGEEGHVSRDCPSGGGGGSGGGNRNRACFKCNEEGHMSRDCPNDNSGGGGRSRGCFKCGEEGHMSRDCPSDNGSSGGGGNRSRGCFKCGEDGHMSRECPNDNGGGGGNRGRGCFKCGEEGHMSRDCPSDNSGGGSSNRSRGCFKCGEEGHMSRDCPNDNSGGGGGGGNRGRGCFKCGEEGHMSRDCTNESSSGGGGGGSRGGQSRACFKCGEEGHQSRECTNPESNTRPDGKPRVPLYIPPEFSNDESTVFETVPTGINFSKYESIPVDVTGCDAKPIITFEMANLNQHLLKNVKRSGYEVPTPIQKYAIPIVMNGLDLMGCAQTGSGKTAAFLLPMIHSMLIDLNLPNNNGMKCQEPLALILAPTRELAMQIMAEAKKFAYDSIVRSEVVYGGTSTGHQISLIEKGVHILVATPGRLNDLLSKNKVSLEKLKYFVLDEADRMLDMGFMPAVKQMVDVMPPKGERQTLMFSATFAEEIQRLAADFLTKDYCFISVGKVGGANSDVEQVFFKLGQYEKRDKLMEILQESGGNRVLVFVEQKRTADFLASYTSQNNIPTTSIHGDRLQREREEALADFRKGRMPVLVATAVAARGLDIKDVRHVINYDLPQSIDEYVHRIGRTGRVGNLGKATSFYDAEADRPLARDLKKILVDAQQVLPDWLHEEANNAIGTTTNYSRSGFGGKDFRNQGRSRNPQASQDAWDDNYSSQSNEAAQSYSQPVQADDMWD